MLTFQILDAGDPYYRPLEDRAITVGSDSGADICLDEEGVAATHALVDVRGDRCTISAVGGNEVCVNGNKVATAELALGDRVELGKATLVLGQQVKRPATPTDVLEASARARRLEPFHSGRSPEMKRVLAGVIVLGLIAAAFMWWTSKEAANDFIPNEDREAILHARKQGRFDDADAVLDRLQNEWVLGHEGRQTLVRDARIEVRETREQFDKLHARFMADVLRVRQAQQLLDLKVLRDKGRTAAEREAANILMANLTEYRLQAEKLAEANGMSEHDERPGGPVAKRGTAKVVTPRPAWLDDRMAEIAKFHGEKNFAHALEMARVTLADVPAQHAEPLRDLMARMRTEARQEMRALVDQAYALRNAGKIKDGVKLLEKEVMRFPGEGSLSLLYRELGYLSAEAGMPAPQVRKINIPRITPPPVVAKAPGKKTDESTAPETAEVAEKSTGPLDKALIARTLADVRKAEAAGDLSKAVQLLEESAVSNADYQPRLAAHVRELAKDLKLIVAVADGVAAKADTAKGASLKLSNGDRAKITKIAGHHIHVAVSGKPDTLGWLDLSVAGAEALAEVAGLEPGVRLGVAALGYRRGDIAETEAFLARLLAKDTRLFARASAIISRGRGEYIDKQGYALVNGKFVARRFLAVAKLAKTFERQMARLAGMTDAERAKVLNQMRANKEPGAEDALTLAMKNRLEALIDKLSRNAMPKSLAKLRARRIELDKARQHAKDLIYDTVKYFYPYKPPAVSGAKFSEYNKVQKEVDVRVAAVRKIWLDKTKVPISAVLKKDIALLLWYEHELGLLGEVTDRALQRVDWARSIPPGAAVTLRNFCMDAEEKQRLVHFMKIEALNEALGEKLSGNEVTQLEVTNSYRVMFGHRPVAISLKLHEAARGHADEMATMGYFSHTSPVKERKTPFKRMKLAGYDYGVSENIALGGSAESAHIRWCHSSGHHRNLLRASHTEFGIGNSGKYWVQNFGRGTDYLQEDDFKR